MQTEIYRALLEIKDELKGLRKDLAEREKKSRPTRNEVLIALRESRGEFEENLQEFFQRKEEEPHE